MSADMLFQQAQSAHQSGNPAEAERLYRAAINWPGDHVPSRRLLAQLLMQRGAVAEAETHIARAVQLAPGDPFVHQNHALLLSELSRSDDAIAAANRAIALKPDFARAYVIRGHARSQSGRPAKAISDYEKALSLGHSSDASLYFGLGNALMQSGEPEKSLVPYGQAMTLSPDFVQAVVNRGLALKELNRPVEALAHFDRAVLLDPRLAQHHALRGTQLFRLGYFDQAAAAYERALAIEPDNAQNWLELGNALRSADQYEKAMIAYERASALDNDLTSLTEMRLHTAMHLCDWTDFETRCSALLADVEAGRLVQPFALLCVPSSPQQQRRASETLAAQQCPPQPRPKFPRRQDGTRLRVAYVSAMFRFHPVALLIADMLEQHDRSQFEIFGISHGIDDKSPIRARVAAAMEHFIDVSQETDQGIAERMRALGIDIAIDMDGYTEGARPAILSYRPARIQAAYLAFPGTSGAAHMDYIIGDPIVTPPEHRAHFREKIIALPHCYLPPSARPVPDAPMSRTDAGLPPEGFVFCSFNNAYKILPDMFALWMRVLARRDNSILWLRGDNKTMQDNLRKEARRHNIDPARLIFAPRVGGKEHFARLALADLFLDTAPYNAHTTAADALWCGVPLVTMLGETFPARVAASLVTAAGVPDLITNSTQEYENLAVALAHDPARLAALKQRLRDNRATTPAFDSTRYARDLEAVFHFMWERQGS